MHVKLDFPYFTTYRTPWCDMVCPEKSRGETIHFYYPLHALAEEILMITSTLGSRRGTEAAAHLLDLISMTKDETPQFVSFVKTAMAKVFINLAKYTRNIQSAYNFDEGYNTVVIDTHQPHHEHFHKGDWVFVNKEPYIAKEDGHSHERDFMDKLEKQKADFRHSVHYTIEWKKNMNPNCRAPLDQFLFDALKYCVIYEWLHIAYPNEEEPYLARYQEALESIRQTCSQLINPNIDRIPSIF